ncbi:MAG: hypothetical protein LUD72_02215 [Bacteroidales bacterium]|nr:hypothetical protein [Bacteroidales bacterium]
MADEKKLSDRQMLDLINEAIANVMIGGQSYKIGSRSLSRADLNTLRNMQADYEARVAETEKGFLDDCYVAFFNRR